MIKRQTVGNMEESDFTMRKAQLHSIELFRYLLKKGSRKRLREGLSLV